MVSFVLPAVRGASDKTQDDLRWPASAKTKQCGYLRVGRGGVGLGIARSCADSCQRKGTNAEALDARPAKKPAKEMSK